MGEAILMGIDFVGSIQTALPITWFSFFPFNARRREVATAKDQARRSRENAEVEITAMRTREAGGWVVALMCLS